MSTAPNPFDLTGRKALVTGGATGIGKGIALGLAAAGADVALTYRSHAPGEVQAEIEAQGRRSAAVRADFTGMDEAAAEEVVAFAAEALGGLDILVNNAGIIHREESAEMPFDDWRRVLSVNLDSVWLLSQAAGKRMVAQGSGKIVIVASAPLRKAATSSAVKPTRATQPIWVQNVYWYCLGWPLSTCSVMLRVSRVSSGVMIVAPATA